MGGDEFALDDRNEFESGELGEVVDAQFSPAADVVVIPFFAEILTVPMAKVDDDLAEVLQFVEVCQEVDPEFFLAGLEGEVFVSSQYQVEVANLADVGSDALEPPLAHCWVVKLKAVDTIKDR